MQFKTRAILPLFLFCNEKLTMLGHFIILMKSLTYHGFIIYIRRKSMNYSIQKLVDDFYRKIGDDDMKMFENLSPEVALNYVTFLYKKFYSAYPTGEVYETLQDRFCKKVAA